MEIVQASDCVLKRRREGGAFMRRLAIAAILVGAEIACALPSQASEVAVSAGVAFAHTTNIFRDTSATKIPPKSEEPLHSVEALIKGVPADQQHCKSLVTALWLRVDGRNFCVRYWVARPIGASTDNAMVVLPGDIGKWRRGEIALADNALSVSNASLQRQVEVLSGMYSGFGVVIGRPGTFGSSGNHLWDRGQLLEIKVIGAALDALKERYGTKRFHLVGHSGGGLTAAGLAQSRSDLGCVVMASASVSLKTSQRDAGFPLPNKHVFYDPIEHVSAIKHRPDLRMIVLSDLNDKVVSFRSQQEFVERVRAHRLPILQVMAAAADKKSHDLHGHGMRLAVECARGIEEPALIARHQTTTPIARTSDVSLLNRSPTLTTSEERTFEGRAVLYEDDASIPEGRRFEGLARWHDGGEGSGTRGYVYIPERALSLTLTLVKGGNQPITARPALEMRFYLRADFPFGGIGNIQGLLTRVAEHTPGIRVPGIVTPDPFHGTFRFEAGTTREEAQRNTQFLQEHAWLSIPIIYNNGGRAVLSIEKRDAGKRTFESTLR